MMDVLVHPLVHPVRSPDGCDEARLTFVALLHDMLGDAGTVKAG